MPIEFLFYIFFFIVSFSIGGYVGTIMPNKIVWAILQIISGVVLVIITYKINQNIERS